MSTVTQQTMKQYLENEIARAEADYKEALQKLGEATLNAYFNPSAAQPDALSIMMRTLESKKALDSAKAITAGVFGQFAICNSIEEE